MGDLKARMEVVDERGELHTLSLTDDGKVYVDGVERGKANDEKQALIITEVI